MSVLGINGEQRGEGSVACSRTQAYIHGAAVIASWRDASRSLTDLIFDGVSAALADAGMPITKVDSIVLSAHDLIDGRSLSSMVTGPAAGAYMRDEIRLSEDGLVAASLGAARIEAGESDFTIVAAWGRASEGDLLAVSRAGFDPFLQQPFGLSDMEVSAFRLSRWMGRHGDGSGARAQAARIRRDRAGVNRMALHADTGDRHESFPLRPGEGPRRGDMMAAMVIGSAPSSVRISGVGHGTDATVIGDRDLLAMPALTAAARAALSGAGIGPGDIGLFEIDGMTLADEALALEALGLCLPGEGFRLLAADQINPSGGSEAGWCYPAMGLVRLIECYNRLSGSDGAPRRALATGFGAGGAQTATAMILEAT